MLRTPEEAFDGLPDFDFVPRYAELSGPHDELVRIAHLDEGDPDANPVVLLHGEPTWSFLYRTMIPGLVDAGLRVVVPDMVGFGRSDKPRSVAEHSYAAHVEWLRSLLFDHLHLHDITLFCQDWGGLLGLRLVGTQPLRFARVCAANTGLPDGSVRMGETWQRFNSFVQSTADLPIGTLCASGVVEPMVPAVVAAYDAPFPGPEYKAGPKAMPGLIPQAPDAPGAADNRHAWEGLEHFDRPFLCVFSDSDPITAGGDIAMRERIPGTKGQPHTTVHGGHFLQEDAGPELAGILAAWATT